MVGSSSPEHGSGAPKRLTLGFLMSLMAVCAKHASRVSSKLKAMPGPIKSSLKHKYSHKENSNHKTSSSSSPINHPPPKSPLRARPKELLTTLSNKAIMFMHNKKKIDDGKDGSHDVDHDGKDFGDGGVWQRSILMGDKCQPLDFSGVIYYDSTGNQLDEVPLRSPRASPLPGYLARRAEL
ncbi:hypothetical protein Dsin_005479 [Dipteronia sinensis]|uniref:Uncharacterized protein n=1 Tax=Dipteronia sinensis TaxID=43782 RepID=A0AAE0AWX9_9ROSI|nr:hypothetical protein Dsin_005479 [Dipteronia sinensis]